MAVCKMLSLYIEVVRITWVGASELHVDTKEGEECRESGQRFCDERSDEICWLAYGFVCCLRL